VATWRSTRRRIERLERDAPAVRDALSLRLQKIVNGRWLSTATVASLPVTIAARALIADVGGSLPITVVRDGQPVTPVPTIVVRPDPDPHVSRRRWVHRALMSLTGAGNLYVLATRIGSNDWPLAAEVMVPDQVAPMPDPMWPWRVVGWQYGTLALSTADVVHVPLWELDLAQPVAPSPLAACQAAFDDLAQLWAMATAYWTDGGKPPYALKYPSRLNAKQSADALDQWIDARQAHRPGVLSGGWDIADLSMPTAADALLLDGLAYIDQSVGRIYGITPTLLNLRAETGSLTYSNAVDEVRRWLSLSAYPTWLARVEDALTQMLPAGQQALFDTEAFGALGMVRPGLDEARPADAPAPPAPAPPADQPVTLQPIGAPGG